MNEALLKSFSPSAQRVLRLLAASPQDAADFYNRLTIFRAALRIGLEVVEANIHTAKDDLTREACKTTSMAALGSCTAIECTMTVLENLHPELGKMNISRPPEANERPGRGPDFNYLGERFKNLDL